MKRVYGQVSRQGLKGYSTEKIQINCVNDFSIQSLDAIIKAKKSFLHNRGESTIDFGKKKKCQYRFSCFKIWIHPFIWPVSVLSVKIWKKMLEKDSKHSFLNFEDQFSSLSISSDLVDREGSWWKWKRRNVSLSICRAEVMLLWRDVFNPCMRF